MNAIRVECLAALLVTCGLVTAAAPAASGNNRESPLMEITIDVRDLSRKLVHAELTLPLQPA